MRSGFALRGPTYPMIPHISAYLGARRGRLAGRCRQALCLLDRALVDVPQVLGDLPFRVADGEAQEPFSPGHGSR